MTDHKLNQPEAGIQRQIYTVAYAVRPNKITTSKKISNPSSNDKRRLESCYPLTDHRSQVSDTVIKIQERINRKVTVLKQPRSTLPMKMIVSRKVTRKPEIKSPVGHDSVDLAACRNHKLTPPPWLNRNSYNKKRRPTETETLIEAMKKRCNEFNAQTNDNSIGQPNPSDLEDFLYSEENKNNILLMTPRNEYAYSQLCGKNSTIDARCPSSSFHQEDPLPECENHHSRSKSPSLHSLEEAEKGEEDFVFNPRLSPIPLKEPEFIWNPVISKPKTTYGHSLFDSINESGDYLPEDQLVDDLHHRLNFPSPVTPSSSCLTVEEETLRCTLLTKPDSRCYLKENYQSSFLLPRRNDITCSNFRNRRPSAIPKLSRFYEE